MKKLTLLFLSFLMVSAMNAMEEKPEKSQLQVGALAITNGLIFDELYWSNGYEWSSGLEVFIRKPNYVFGKDGFIRFKGKLSDDDKVKLRIIDPAKKPAPNQSCSVFIDREYKVKYFNTFFSKIFFDENGDLGHIETEITLEGLDQVEKFENMHGLYSDMVCDDQTKGKKVINEENHVIWSFITGKMTHDAFVSKFCIREDWNKKSTQN